MELRNRATGAVITDSQFRAENKNTSFPPQLTAEIIDSFGYDPVLEGPQATTIPPYQYSQRDGVVEVNGQWFTHYIAGPIFTDYTDPTAWCIPHLSSTRSIASVRMQNKASLSALIATSVLLTATGPNYPMHPWIAPSGPLTAKSFVT
jgi:hypothetical protein